MRVIGGLLKNIGNKYNQIPIPFYMKVNLGFEPDTYVYFFIPKGRKELILTPINPFYWWDLWKINLILRERVGVVSDVLDLIKEAGAYYCISETVTTEIDKKHELGLGSGSIKVTCNPKSAAKKAARYPPGPPSFTAKCVDFIFSSVIEL